MRVFAVGLLVVGLIGVAAAQSWSAAYDTGLSAAHGKKWGDARTAFKNAAAFRPEDSADPTRLPGPISERKLWRNGAPYSPNFLAGYCGLKAASELSGEEQAKLYQAVAEEMEGLLAKGQQSSSAYWVLNSAYTALGDSQKLADLDTRAKAAAGKMGWKVDIDGMTPEDVSAANPGAVVPGGQTPAGGGTGPQPIPVGNGNPGANTTATPAGRVATVATKYAFIVGNSESKMEGAAVPFASDSAQAIREALVTNAGYPEANVELVINCTKDQLMATAKAFADRLPKGATVFFYFTGNGTNVDGKDYLAGVDTSMPTDTTSMVAKGELFRLFLPAEVKLFSFFEVSRPNDRGRFFGAEIPMFGRVSQMQATISGGSVESITAKGKTIGVFANACCDVLGKMRANQVQITEFGWLVFERIRGGSGGGGSQVPTLPVLVQMPADSPF